MTISGVMKMNKLGITVILFTAILFSCGEIPSNSPVSEAVETPFDITTKVVNGKTIPDTILGFRVGMSSAEVHQVAAKRGMVKEGELRSDIDFKNGIFFGHQVRRITLTLRNGAVKDITFFLKQTNRTTLDRAVEELTKHFGTPAIGDEEDVTERKWRYGSGHYLSVRLNSSRNSLMITYST